MRLFKKKEALSLEDKLVETISKFNTNISSLSAHIYDQSKVFDKHKNIGFGTLAVGAFGVAGSIGFLAMAPAVATVAVAAGFTAFGTAMIGSGAVVLAGAGYMGLSKLAEKFTEAETRFDPNRESKLAKKLDDRLRNILKDSDNPDYTLSDIKQIKDLTEYSRDEKNIRSLLDLHKSMKKNKI